MMKRRSLGRSSLMVSEIGFGCMSLGKNQRLNERILLEAVEQGINFFDTADLYDRGQNEATVGRVLKGVRDQVLIATKVGNRWREDGSGWDWVPSGVYIKQAVGESLKRLKTDRIDLYQLHGGTLDDPIDEIIATFETLQAEGVIRAYGISSIRPNVIREWVKRSSMASVMMQYSLLDRRPEEAMLDLLHENRISVIARGPLAKGILSSAGSPKAQEGYLNYPPDELEQLRKQLTAVAAGRDMTQVALRYPLAHPAVATVIPGASRLEQLHENASAAQLAPLTDGDLAALRHVTRASTYELHR
jgi:aryl-alcohol dehydrogenase-like predicted oxidoreductase